MSFFSFLTTVFLSLVSYAGNLPVVANDVVGPFNQAINQNSANFSVIFPGLNGIKVGDPVVVEGQLVGTVGKIETILSNNNASNNIRGKNIAEKYLVDISISTAFKNLVKEGSVALITSPLSTVGAQPENVVELFLPRNNTTALAEGAKIVGYSSFEAYWSA